jgi:hypothetical protein
MSPNVVQTIIRRAVADLEFRKVLVSDPRSALVDYDLTEEERERLSKIDAKVFDGSAGDLEGRLSRGWMN